MVSCSAEKSCDNNDYTSCPRKASGRSRRCLPSHNVPSWTWERLSLWRSWQQGGGYDDSDVRQLHCSWRHAEDHPARGRVALQRRDLLLGLPGPLTTYLLRSSGRENFGHSGRAQDVDQVHILENQELQSEAGLEYSFAVVSDPKPLSRVCAG